MEEREFKALVERYRNEMIERFHLKKSTEPNQTEPVSTISDQNIEPDNGSITVEEISTSNQTDDEISDEPAE